MKNMDKGLTVPKWVLIFWPKISKMPQNLSAQFVCPSPIFLDFNEQNEKMVNLELVSIYYRISYKFLHSFYYYKIVSMKWYSSIQYPWKYHNLANYQLFSQWQKNHTVHPWSLANLHQLANLRKLKMVVGVGGLVHCRKKIGDLLNYDYWLHCKYVQWNYSGSAFKKL